MKKLNKLQRPVNLMVCSQRSAKVVQVEQQQESRAAARKPRDAASVLFG